MPKKPVILHPRNKATVINTYELLSERIACKRHGSTPAIEEYLLIGSSRPRLPPRNLIVVVYFGASRVPRTYLRYRTAVIRKYSFMMGLRSIAFPQMIGEICYRKSMTAGMWRGRTMDREYVFTTAVRYLK